MFTSSVGVFTAAVLCCSSGSAQTAAAPTIEPGLTLHAVARRLASPPDQEARLHWVPDPFPGASNVLVTDPSLRTAVVAALQRLAAADPVCPTWVLENSQTCTLGARLERELTAFAFHVRDDVALLDAPEQEGAELSLTLRVDYAVSPAAGTVSRVRSLLVRVSTEHVQQGAADMALTLSARDAAARAGGAPPPAAFLEVPITVRLTEADRIRPGGGSFPVETLQTELFRAGLNAIRAAGDGGLTPSGPPPSPGALTALDDTIAGPYLLERPAWSASNAKTTHDGDDFFIDLVRLRFVSRAKVDVHAAVIERENGRFTFEGATAAGEAKLAALRRAAAEHAEARLRSAPDPLEGTIPTRDRILEAVAALQQEHDIQLIDRRAEADGTIAFEAVFRDVESEIGAKADLQATLDPERFLMGSAVLHEHNILYALLRRNVQEDIDLIANGGPQVQDLTLDVSVARERGTTHVVSYGVMARTFFSRDTNQRLGNLLALGSRNDSELELVDREWGEVPKLFLQYEWQGGWRQRVRWEAGLDWRQVLIRPRLDVLPATVDGHLTAWDNSLEYRLSHDFTPALASSGGGVGDVTLVATGVDRQGTQQLSGDFDFSRLHVSSTIEALLGWRTRRDLLLRHEWTAGGASDATPLFQLHRLGGPTNVRGIEEGEYVGQRLRAQQFTVGVALPVFWPALAQPGGGPAELANAYVMTFYDRGGVTRDGSAADAHGYGLGIEIRNLPAGKRRAHISIGWARSPQSLLHRRGVMTMGVRFSL